MNLLREYIRELLYEGSRIVPTSMSMSEWESYKKRNKTSAKAYDKKTKTKWKITHGPGHKDAGKTIKSNTGLTYTKAKSVQNAFGGWQPNPGAETTTMKPLITKYVLIALVAAACLTQSCSDWFMEDPVYYAPPAVAEDLVEDLNSSLSAREYEKLCIRTEYYFCPGVSGPLMRIEITKDVCADPPVVLSMSDCE